MNETVIVKHFGSLSKVEKHYKYKTFIIYMPNRLIFETKSVDKVKTMQIKNI